LHGVSLTGSCLSVGEDGHDSDVKNKVDYGADCVEVEFLVRLVFVESIIKLELLVVHVLGDAIYLEFRLVYDDFRVLGGNTINLLVLCFMLEKGPLFDTN
jgi:hypothetical protein